MVQSGYSSSDSKTGKLSGTLANKDSNPIKKNDGEEDEEYDEENDDDYDPSKPDDKNAEELSDDDEDVPDYSGVSGVSQVRTRGQIYSGNTSNTSASKPSDLVHDYLRVDVDALFKSLDNTDPLEWRLLLPAKGTDGGPNSLRKQPAKDLMVNDEEEQILIVTTYTFAGKLVRDKKLVAADSAEARAYLNSTSGLVDSGNDAENHRSSVAVIRKVQGTDEERPLRIKLKRSSLIDKFLARDKKNKLTTLEKSRLDWASFVDKKKIRDDLAHHNKGGYLEKQAFLDRVETKRDIHYQEAKDRDRQQQWQQQQKQAL